MGSPFMAAWLGQRFLLLTFLLSEELTPVFIARGGFLHVHIPAWGREKVHAAFDSEFLLWPGLHHAVLEMHLGDHIYSNKISISMEEGDNDSSPWYTYKTFLSGERKDTFYLGCKSELTCTKSCSPDSINSSWVFQDADSDRCFGMVHFYLSHGWEMAIQRYPSMMVSCPIRDRRERSPLHLNTSEIPSWSEEQSE